jgi:hypothetical protein
MNVIATIKIMPRKELKSLWLLYIEIFEMITGCSDNYAIKHKNPFGAIATQ